MPKKKTTPKAKRKTKRQKSRSVGIALDPKFKSKSMVDW